MKTAPLRKLTMIVLVAGRQPRAAQNHWRPHLVPHGTWGPAITSAIRFVEPVIQAFVVAPLGIGLVLQICSALRTPLGVEPPASDSRGL